MPTTWTLNDAQIVGLKRYVNLGLPWLDANALQRQKAAASNHWSFRPPVRYSEPKVRFATWVRNPIDGFVLARLEKEGLKPSPEADKVILVRRLYLDLLGLPPSPS